MRFIEDLPHWELTVNLQKFVAVCIQLFLPRSPAAQTVLGIISVSIALASGLYLKPYRRRIVNRLSTTLLVMQLVQLLTAGAGWSGRIGPATVDFVLLGCLIVALIVIAVESYLLSKEPPPEKPLPPYKAYEEWLERNPGWRFVDSNPVPEARGQSVPTPRVVVISRKPRADRGASRSASRRL